jgi:hypothetical protein
MMQSRSRFGKRISGYSLIEMLVYVAILAVGVNLCGALFVTSMRLSALGSEKLERIQGAAELENEFREAVRSGEAVIPEFGAYRSGPGQVVLRAGAVDGAPRYLVLGAVRDAEHLSKLEIIDRPGKPEAAAFVTYAPRLSALEFTYDVDPPASARLVRMAFSGKLSPGEPEARQTGGSAAAALRGINAGGGQ